MRCLHSKLTNVGVDEGPNSAFAVGPQAAHATLDGIRAVLQSGAFSNISSNARTVMWGYSGGALATEWAAEFQPQYAPELNIVGAASGGLTPNVSSVFQTVNGGPSASLAVAGLNGLGAAYPRMLRYLDSQLKPATAATFRASLTGCLDAVADLFVDQNIFDYFKNGSDVLTDAIPAAYINVGGVMGLRGTPSISLYFYKAVKDEISVISDTDELYAQFCADGADITYQRNSFGEHSLDFLFGAPGAVAWLKDKLDGVDVSEGCVLRIVTITTIPEEDAALLGQTAFDYLSLVLEWELADLSY